MLEHAEEYNARIVLVNRRDYPGSDPYTQQERKLLISEGEEDHVINENMQTWMNHRARELYEFLGIFCRRENIPSYIPSEKTGGIILAGWSLGTSFMTAMLANIQDFPTILGGIDMMQYLRHVVFYGPSMLSSSCQLKPILTVLYFQIRHITHLVILHF